MIAELKGRALGMSRKGRTALKRFFGLEPAVDVDRGVPLKHFGNKGYGGWAVPDGLLRPDSVVIDIGLGDDISFSSSIISQVGCLVHGFDPTPKSIAYVNDLGLERFILHTFGVAGSNRGAVFFLPNNPAHVSGSIAKSSHVGSRQIEIKLIDFENVLRIVDVDHVDLLKIDIEGAEYEFLDSESFRRNSHLVKIICIEFHHRWSQFGSRATLKAVESLSDLGFRCVWRQKESNEEFTFLNMRTSF